MPIVVTFNVIKILRRLKLLIFQLRIVSLKYCRSIVISIILRCIHQCLEIVTLKRLAVCEAIVPDKSAMWVLCYEIDNFNYVDMVAAGSYESKFN